MNKLVTIIVPVYNVKEYLEKCVGSLVKQTYKNIEMILVDDGSTDGSGKLCDEISETDNRIIVIHKENGGLSSARNIGIDNASGEYLSFIDSDDFVENSMIEEMMKLLEEKNAEIAICNRYHFFDDGEQNIKYKLLEKEMVMDSEEAIYELNSFKNFDMSACCKLFKKDLFNEIRFPIGKISEDFYIMYILFDYSNKIVYTSKPLYHYLQRRGSITKTGAFKYDFADAAYQQMLYVEKKYPNLKTCVHAAFASANMTVYNICVNNGGKCSKENKKILQKNVKENYRFIKDSKDWSKAKRIQSFLFIKCIPLYRILLKAYKKINKI